MQYAVNILMVDNDLTNLSLVSEFLSSHNYHVTTAVDGENALDIIKKQPFDLILLDWMMPKMSGIELVRILKKDEQYKHIPVILQTAKACHEDMVSGIEAGAYYYLTKPYGEEVLLSVLKGAVRDIELRLSLLKKIEDSTVIFNFVDNCTFSFQTISEARSLAQGLGAVFHLNDNATLGLAELFFNAIEHGNLGLTYDEKTALIDQDLIQDEIERRLQLPENLEKRVELKMERTAQSLVFWLKDQGKGFDFKKYMTLSTDRLLDNHGRGIVMANDLFDEMQYLGKGNEIKIVIHR